MLAQAAPAAKVPPPLASHRGEWLFEPKMDGLRCIAVRNGGEVSLLSRNNLPFNARFPRIVAAVAALPVDNVVLDGEIVGMSRGKPDFGALQKGSAERVEYWVFDLTWLFGKDLRQLPIEARKALLEKAVPESAGIKVVKQLEGDPHGLFDGLCQQGWEGLMAKRVGSTYRSGRASEWYKLKCGCRQEFVIGGFTAPGGSRSAFGALLLGYWEAGELAYAGKVGTGFNEASLGDLLARMLGIERRESPFAERVGERGARWVEPELVAEVSFTNWTVEGRLRHPSFLGLRPDKPGRGVVREDCGPGRSGPGPV